MLCNANVNQATQAADLTSLLDFVLFFFDLWLMSVGASGRCWELFLRGCEILEVPPGRACLLHAPRRPVQDMRRSPAASSSDILIEVRLKALFSHRYLLQS